jgi:FMN reductase
MTTPLFIVGIGGTLREGSTSEHALRLALTHASQLGCDTQLFAGPELDLALYDPRRQARSPAESALVEALRRADGVIFSTPSYHGSVSGLIKNAIDYIEDMNQDDRVYLSGRAVGCMVCAYGPQAMGTTLSAMRDIVHSLRGWPTPFGAAINVTQQPFGHAGSPADPAVVQACETVALEVVQFAQHGRNAR